MLILVFSPVQMIIPLSISTWFLKYRVSLEFFSISKYQVWNIKKSIWFRNWFLQATQAVKIKFELEKKSSWFWTRFFSEFEINSEIQNSKIECREIGRMTHPLHKHTFSVKRFSENFDHKAVTYLIFFVGTHWFQKCNFWKNSLSPFWGRRGRWGQTTSKLKITKILNENPLKIDEIQNLASATSKMASATSRISEGAQWIFPKNTFFKSGQSTEKNEL